MPFASSILVKALVESFAQIFAVCQLVNFAGAGLKLVHEPSTLVNPEVSECGRKPPKAFDVETHVPSVSWPLEANVFTLCFASAMNGAEKACTVWSLPVVLVPLSAPFSIDQPVPSTIIHLLASIAGPLKSS